MRPRRHHARLLAALAAAVAAIVAVDLLAGPAVSMIGVLVVAPLVASLWLSLVTTAVVGAVAVVIALALGVPNEFFGGTNHLTRVLPVVIATAVAVWTARLRADRERAVRLLALQGGVSLVLNESRTLSEAGPRILSVIGEALGLQVGAIWRVDADGEVLVRIERWSAPGFEAEGFDASGGRTVYTPGVGLPGTVWQTGRALLLPELAQGSIFVRAQAAAEAGLQMGLAFPIPSGDDVIGVVELFGTGTAEVGDDELEMLAGLGRQIGAYIERTRIHEERSHIAQTLQDSLLPPSLPEVPRLEVAARYRAAGEETEVGGDFYDLFQTGDRTWAAVIGDVQGKGPEAAAMIGLARHTLRAGAMRESNPKQVLTTLNEAMSMEGGDDSFCTTLLATIWPTDPEVAIEVTSAGHPLPLILRADGAVESAGTPGTLVGAVSHLELTPERVTLDPGDALVLFTDGVYEAGSGSDRFGHNRLESLLRASRGAEAVQLAARIERDVLAFEDGEPSDDMAILVLRRCPLAADPAGEARDAATA